VLPFGRHRLIGTIAELINYGLTGIDETLMLSTVFFEQCSVEGVGGFWSAHRQRGGDEQQH
jgi:hypothetical protein